MSTAANTRTAAKEIANRIAVEKPGSSRLTTSPPMSPPTRRTTPNRSNKASETCVRIVAIQVELDRLAARIAPKTRRGSETVIPPGILKSFHETVSTASATMPFVVLRWDVKYIANTNHPEARINARRPAGVAPRPVICVIVNASQATRHSTARTSEMSPPL